MTVRDLLNKVARLMGDSVNFTVSDSDIERVNEIGEDLCDFTEVTSEYSQIDSPKKVLEAFPYGVAMLTAFARNESEAQEFFCGIYNAKRAAAKCGKAAVTDVLPKAVN